MNPGPRLGARLAPVLRGAGAASVAASLLLSSCASRSVARVVVRLEQGSHRLQLTAEVAATPARRERGLMGRRRIDAAAGMLFLFPGGPQTEVFWMKGTLVPLDIAFVRAGRVTDVHRMVPCRADPCPTTASSGPVDSALEAASGTFERAGIDAGATLALLGTVPSPS